MTVRPKIAWFTTNQSCNLRCKWCYERGGNFDPHQTLSLNLALRLLGIIQELEIRDLIIIGGEPTLWSHLLEFNGRCRQVGIQTTLVTNAYKFSEDDFWTEYLKSPNDKVSPSVKAFDEPSMKRLVQVSGVDFIQKGLERLVQKYNCGVSFVFSSFVKHDMVSLAKFAKSCGAIRISVSPCTPSFSDNGVDPTGMVALKEMVEIVTSEYPHLHELMEGNITLSIKTPFCLWPKDFIDTLRKRGQLHSGCQFQGRSGIIFGPQGELLACNSMAKFPIGELDKDYSDAKSLISLLNSEEVVRNYDHINSYPSEKCIGCSQINSCGGGCPLMWTVYDATESIPGWENP